MYRKFIDRFLLYKFMEFFFYTFDRSLPNACLGPGCHLQAGELPNARPFGNKADGRPLSDLTMPTCGGTKPPHLFHMNGRDGPTDDSMRISIIQP